MGQTMVKTRDPAGSKPPLLPLSRDHHNDDDTTIVSLLYWFWKLCTSITRCFRIAAPKPPPADSNLANNPYSNNNVNDQHCVVDHVIEIEEPILATTGIGIERWEAVEKERPPLPPPPQPSSTKSKKRASDQEQKILLVSEEEEEEEEIYILVSPLPSTKSKSKKRESLGPCNRKQKKLLIEEEEVELPLPLPLPPPPPPASTKSKTKKRASLGPYNREQKILLVGDGDFSFSASLAVAFGDAPNIIATSLDSFDFLMKNYTKAVTNIMELTSRSCEVIHSVDATKMARHPQLRSLKFDRIVYNFPHAGFANRKASREDQISKHQALVKGFLKNAKKMIKEEDGQIHITHKCVGFFLEWNIEMLGSSQGLQLVEESPFKLKHYPGYATKYGFGGDTNFDWRPSKTYKFQLSK